MEANYSVVAPSPEIRNNPDGTMTKKRKTEISTSMRASHAATRKLNALWLHIMSQIWKNKESNFNDNQKPVWAIKNVEF